MPTKLSGVRHRDSPEGNDPKKMSLGHVDKETCDDIVKGTLVDDFQKISTMQPSDQQRTFLSYENQAIHISTIAVQ